jgi:GT2 family glycosyltransferase
VAIVIPTCNGLQYTKLCLESVRRCTFHPYEIIVVDNSSSDGTVEFLRGQSDVKLIINSENRGYPTACNQGIRASSAPYILLMNNDVVVTEGWLNRMFQAYFADAEVGLVGPRTNDCAGFQKMSAPHYETQSELEEFAQRMKRGAVRQFRQVDNLSGFCLLIDRKVVKKIGMLDERFGIGNYEDQDFCRRAERAGFKLFIANEVYVHHYGSRAFIENKFEYHKILEENRRKFEQKWEAVAV